jgi:hypothetical protein
MTDDYVNIYEPEHDEYAYLTDSPKSKQHQACNTSLIYYSPMRTCPIQVFCDLPSGVAAQLRRDTKNNAHSFFCSLDMWTSITGYDFGAEYSNLCQHHRLKPVRINLLTSRRSRCSEAPCVLITFLCLYLTCMNAPSEMLNNMQQ